MGYSRLVISRMAAEAGRCLIGGETRRAQNRQASQKVVAWPCFCRWRAARHGANFRHCSRTNAKTRPQNRRFPKAGARSFFRGDGEGYWLLSIRNTGNGKKVHLGLACDTLWSIWCGETMIFSIISSMLYINHEVPSASIVFLLLSQPLSSSHSASSIPLLPWLSTRNL